MAFDNVAEARRPLSITRVALGTLLALLAAQIIYFVVTNERFEWPVVFEYLFASTVLIGLGYTVLLAVITMAIGTILAIALAAAQLSDFGPVRWAAITWVGFFRGIPPLVQLIFWYNLGYLVPHFGIGIPFGPTIIEIDANELVTPFSAAVIGLSLMQSAYMAEIIRGGLLGVDSGQRDAAHSLGFAGFETFWRIILPQAMRMIIPPSGSQFISLVKATSLVSVIAMPDLLRSVQVIYNRTYQVVPMLLVACIWYLVLVTVLTLIQRRIESHYSRGHIMLSHSGVQPLWTRRNPVVSRRKGAAQ